MFKQRGFMYTSCINNIIYVGNKTLMMFPINFHSYNELNLPYTIRFESLLQIYVYLCT